MKNLRKRFEIFCYRHRNIGLPNLMLFLSLATGLIYLITYITQNLMLYEILCFDRDLILKGQVWRLFSFCIVSFHSNPLMMLVSLFCYYSLGRAMENTWGTLKFNLFYLSGILLMDIFCMIFGGYANVYYLNLSLFLGYATIYPDASFLLFFFIPVKAWILALFNLVLTLAGLFAMPFTAHNLFPLIALGNYFLFFGKDVVNLIPFTWRANLRRLFRKKKTYGPQKSKVIPFPNAGSYQATVATAKAPYNHRCTVCGRTDVSHPDLEFRYCSRCNGYYCYCEDHISNHTHIQ